MAESFGADVDRYDRARMPYPADLFARTLDLSPGPEILDVGCGTGIEARQLQTAGAHVLGVEPDARMAAYARSRGLTVEESRFEGVRSMPSSPRRRGTGSTRWPAPRRRGRRCVRADCSQPSGTSTSRPRRCADALLEGLREVAPDLALGLGAMNQADKTYAEGARQVGERFVELGGTFTLDTVTVGIAVPFQHIP